AGAGGWGCGGRGTGRRVGGVRDRGGGGGVGGGGDLGAGGGIQKGIGGACGDPAVFPPYSTIGPPKSLTSFLNQGAAGGELATLVQLVAAGRLAVEVGWRGPWQQVAEAAQALVGRRVNGKAILDVRPAAG